MVTLRKGAGTNSVVITNKMQATKAGNIESVKYYDAQDDPAAIDNGHVLMLDGLDAGEREIKRGIAPAAVTDEVVLVAAPELIYDEQFKADGGLDDFQNEADRPARAYHLYRGDIFSVSDGAINALGAAPVVGNMVVVDPGETMLVEVAPGNIPANAKFIGEIIRKDVLGTAFAMNVRTVDLTVIQVKEA